METAMLKLLATTALASAFVLGCAAISPVSAGGPGMRYHNSGGGHYRFQGHRPAMKTFKPILRPYRPIHLRPVPGPIHQKPMPIHWRHGSHMAHWRHGSQGWPHWRFGSWGYAVPVGVGVATYAATAPAQVCTCLTKDYLEDGSVRFTDTCTKEFAVSPPAPPAPAQ
jgi:hypothetical protein